jgi:hypothetical protein
MDRNHAARAPKAPTSAQGPPPKPRNVTAILDLGNLVYFTFRGRAYGVPPLPYKAGQRLLTLWVEALQFTGSLTVETAPRYFAILRQVPGLLWRHTRPCGPLRRALKRLHLHRNPFHRATEAELVELASFFLRRRMTSGVGLPGPKSPQSPPT